MNAYWTKPALHWTPVRSGLCTLFVYAACGQAITSWPKLEELALILPIAGLLVPFPFNVLARFGKPDATEWLLGAGLTRRAMALRYAFDQVWWSLVHTAGFTMLWALAPDPTTDLLRTLRNSSLLDGVAPIFFGLLAGRSAFAAIAHLENSTWVPARMRDALRRAPGPWLARGGWWTLSILIFLVLLAAPVLLCERTASWHWLAVPAALYLRLAYSLAASAECTLSPDSISMTASGAMEKTVPGRPAPPLELPPDAGPSGVRGSALRSLCWDGLNRWVRRALWLYPFFGIALAVLAQFFPPSDEPEAFWMVAGLLAVLPLLIVFFFHKDLFRWAANDQTVEYLLVRGVPVRTMTRIRLAAAGLVAALLLAGYLLPWPERFRAPVVTGMLLFACGVVLLEGNPSRLRRRFLSCERVDQVGNLVRATLWMTYVAALLLWSPLREFGSLFWGTVGLLCLVPAAVLWAGGVAGAFLKRA